MTVEITGCTGFRIRIVDKCYITSR